VFILNSALVSWRSSKQSIVVTSTTEEEYVAAAEAAHGAVWLKKFITELRVCQPYVTPILLSNL
jgi:hypothetical protein